MLSICSQLAKNGKPGKNLRQSAGKLRVEGFLVPSETKNGIPSDIGITRRKGGGKYIVQSFV